MTFDRDDLHATIGKLVAATRRSEDGALPDVAAAADACDAAVAEWREGGLRAVASEPVLQAANGLLDVLYAANPEGLPFGVRDDATEMLTLLDQAEEAGFQVRPDEPPAP